MRSKDKIKKLKSTFATFSAEAAKVKESYGGLNGWKRLKGDEKVEGGYKTIMGTSRYD